MRTEQDESIPKLEKCDQCGGVMMVTDGDYDGYELTCQNCGKAVWVVAGDD